MWCTITSHTIHENTLVQNAFSWWTVTEHQFSVYLCFPVRGERIRDTQGVEAPRKLMFRIQQIKSKPLDIKSRETQGSEGKWIREITMHSLQERHIQLQKALQRTVISEWHIHQRCVGNKKNRVLLSWLLACSTCGNQKHCKCGKCDMHLVLTYIKTE